MDRCGGQERGEEREELVHFLEAGLRRNDARVKASGRVPERR